jgi:hypothetical protein
MLSLGACGGESGSSGSASSSADTNSASAVNTAPVISGTPGDVLQAGYPYYFMPQASDADGDTLTFAIAGKPAWASFDTTNGHLSGTPLSADIGQSGDIVISVTDQKARVSMAAFRVQVTMPSGAQSANVAPRISGAPAGAVVAGSTYIFQPSANDPNGDPLAFAVLNKPVWALFDTATGRLSGTPSKATVGQTAGIVITVSDGKSMASLAPFAVEVIQLNQAPTISGTPSSSVAAGTPYSYQPVAIDNAGNKLTFSIANKPAWATFDTTTGALKGTPSAAQSGLYANISISVSSSSGTAALPAFSIQVASPAAVGVASLRWVAPTQNTDGTPLTDLAGYHIRYGNTATSLGQSVTLTDPGILTYVVRNLASGTWYFALTAYHGNGIESELSSIVSKTIP